MGFRCPAFQDTQKQVQILKVREFIKYSNSSKTTKDCI